MIDYHGIGRINNIQVHFNYIMELFFNIKKKKILSITHQNGDRKGRFSPNLMRGD